ncbi:rho guanine nucleotide exchange factor 25 [Salvelinus sp. IW2-2015]|uniref:rho guanine nucleotide exchange factor 25 n=1 Tax=Salvelinus sp. IW2-2015 TaxID=2691554 RepID=UPI0038D3CE83
MKGGHHQRGCGCQHLFRKVLAMCGCCFARVRESYSAAGSEGSITPSVGSIAPQASGSSRPCSPSSPGGSRHSVSALKKWLTMPVCKLSVGGGGGKGVRQVHRLDGKQPSTHLPLSQALGRPLEQGENYTILPCTDGDLGWNDGLVSPAAYSPAHTLCHSYLSDLLQNRDTHSLWAVCPSTEPDQKTAPSASSAAPLFWVACWYLIHCPGWWNKQRSRFGKVVFLVVMLNHQSSTILSEEEDGSSLIGDSTSQWSATMDSEEDRRSALEKSIYVLTELIETEKMYVDDLGFIVEGYMASMASQGIPEDMKGKDKIVFGNIHQIYDWHKDYLLGELEKCVAEPNRLAQLFIKHVSLCVLCVCVYVLLSNKPKSEHIVSEYIETYFEDFLKYYTKQEKGYLKQRSHVLIFPISTPPPLSHREAVEVMCFVPKRCNDMMNVGRLQGFEGKITAQGKLLQQDTFTVSEQDSSFLSRAKERRVFLFEQLVIISEPIDRKKGFSLPGYTFKNSIKLSCLGVEDHCEEDPCRLVLTSRGADGSVARFVLQASSQETRRAWVNDVVQILETQRNFLNALQSPIEYQRRESKSNSLRGAMNAPVAPTSGLRPHSSASIDRHRLPNLRSYNTSLPSLHLPSQPPADTQSPLYLSPATPRPSHLPLTSPQQLSNGLRPPAQHSLQGGTDRYHGPMPGEGGDYAPNYSGNHDQLTDLSLHEHEC